VPSQQRVASPENSPKLNAVYSHDVGERHGSLPSSASEFVRGRIRFMTCYRGPEPRWSDAGLKPRHSTSMESSMTFALPAPRINTAAGPAVIGHAPTRLGAYLLWLWASCCRTLAISGSRPWTFRQDRFYRESAALLCSHFLFLARLLSPGFYSSSRRASVSDFPEALRIARAECPCLVRLG